MNKKKITGVLLINLGTPESPTKLSVRRYLRSFLGDPRVIDIPAFLRWLLLNLIILPFRTSKSTEAYKKIWTDKGSPLLIHSKNLVIKLQQQLGEGYIVELGMRYSAPYIADALAKLNRCGISKLIILPLYPQYASSSTGSAIEQTLTLIAKQEAFVSHEMISCFYDHPDYIRSLAYQVDSVCEKKNPDFLLMSFHGLPERQLQKLEDNICVSGPCPEITANNRFCYRAQCYATGLALAKRLDLSADKFDISFQSRLGRLPWIKPYTDEILVKLRERDVKHLAVVCPSFVADCLETEEEIGIALRDQWFAIGGKNFTLVPCLNDSEIWVNAIKNILITNTQ